MQTIDINCDLGEGGAFDGELMPLISSCNIACGGHFGNIETVKEAIALAIRYKVNVGAHPSYPDPVNFGRKKNGISLNELRKSIFQQIMLVKKEVESQNVKLHHVKAHGALYHEISHNEKSAKQFVDVVLEIDDQLILFVPPHSVIQEIAQEKLKTYVEGFADRSYDANYNLLSREMENAVIVDSKKVAQQVLMMVNDKKIPLQNDTFIDCDFDTICIHGDNPAALDILQNIHIQLKEHNIKISGHEEL